MTASGAKEKPVVIWKSKNPRCLQLFDKSVLPVNYFDQKMLGSQVKYLKKFSENLTVD